MKKLSSLLLLIVLVSACKKGENDPFLSLKSRDARLKGTWILKESNYEDRESDGTDTYVYSENFNGSTMSIIETGETTISISYSEKLVINKEGDYKNSKIYDGDVFDNTGSWWWLNDNKKKTRVAFDDDINSFEVDRLTNKELVLKVEYTETYSNNTYTYTAIKKYEKE